MKNLHTLFVSPDTPILKTVEIIDSAGLQIALVVDKAQKLLGTVSDGDIRRALLKGVQLTDPVLKVMNKTPMTATIKETREELLEQMKKKWRHRVPIIDEQDRVVGLHILEELIETAPEKDNPIILMAGGEGNRLRPLTETCPKPLLKIGGKPILETILENFIEYGFRKFFISVNYKAEMIQQYFENGSKWGIQIQYLQENERLGTAGALSLLPEPPLKPVIVMNGDLLTKVNFTQLLDFHSEHKAIATMGIRGYDFQVPYGVVKINKESITTIDEKPMQKFFVNGGIYVLEPEALQMIPKNTHIDMPQLFAQLIESKKQTVAFPIREYWLDIGQIGDFERANGDFAEMFTNDRK